MREVCVLAFSRPPEKWGFKPSRSGKSWWIRLAPERVPNCLLALKERGIGGRAIWPDERPAAPATAASAFKGKKGRNRPRGKSARKAYDEARHQRYNTALLSRLAAKGEQLQHITAIEEVKRLRVEREAGKRRAELKRQKETNRQRDAALRAQAVAALLEHPVGSA